MQCTSSHPISWRSTLMLSFDPGLDTPDGPFFLSQQFLPKPCMHVSSAPTCHTPPWWPQWYLTRITNCEAPPYAEYCGLPSLSIRSQCLPQRPTFEHLLKIENNLLCILIILFLPHRKQSLFLLQRPFRYLLLFSEIMLFYSEHHVKRFVTPFRNSAKVLNIEAVAVCVCMYVRMYIYIYIYVCMYVYVCVCMYLRTYVCMCMYVRTYVCMYVCVCMYICMYVRMYVCVCVCMYVLYVCMSVWMCICMHVCMCVCMYVCNVCMYVCMNMYMYVCTYVRMSVRMYVCTCMYVMYVCIYFDSCILTD